ncbi:asparagine synthase-related protein [Clostridium sp. C2-6-12]|uniref:asparagine synthase-related protein n=1 Tax=Clostridium sp. C2-6-12 TaxID=2698832 RepID=UPI001371CB7A|nr:asparagine synthase-related protein [Clostridium sp. C2-6-12]
MSGIIWGIINLDEKQVSEELGKSMIKSMEKYKIDSYKYILEKNVFVGCGIQYITTESLRERLPYYDTESKLIITADAIIDNREELLDEFELKKNKVEDFTDSEYILMAYKKWGKECPKHLLGNFCFTIWNEEKQELFCGRDHLGTRTYYYYYNGNKFAFCTVSSPLINLIEGKVELNERWIVDYLALDGGHVTEDEETIYKEIKQLQAAHTFVITNDKFEKHIYWNPVEKIKELKLSTDKEYIDAFLNIYTEAIRCRLRGRDEIGLWISGGLDSSSVAAIASKLLKNQGKILKTFSAVPMKQFKDDKIDNRIRDESNNVRLLSEFIGNMDTNFYAFQESNGFNVIDELISIFERPYKIVQNSYWLNNLLKKAISKNCRVVMNGAYGNLTVSFGDFFIHEKTLFSKGKIIKLIREINYFSKNKNISRKRIIKDVIKYLLPHKIKKNIFYRKNPNYDMFEDLPVNNELIEKWNVYERFNDKKLNEIIDEAMVLNKAKEILIDPIHDSEVLDIINKMALSNGIIFRDPTADIRVIEFCLSLPTEQYFKDGVDRRLIRNSMKGLIPEKIRMNMNKSGLQAADWIQRLIPIWEEIYVEIEKAVNEKDIEKYININKVRRVLNTTKNGITERDNEEIVFLLQTLIFAKFINKFNADLINL